MKIQNKKPVTMVKVKKTGSMGATTFIDSRQATARLLQENDLMEFVKSFAADFTNDGKLPSVSVKTDKEAAFYKSDASQLR